MSRSRDSHYSDSDYRYPRRDNGKYELRYPSRMRSSQMPYADVYRGDGMREVSLREGQMEGMREGQMEGMREGQREGLRERVPYYQVAALPEIETPVRPSRSTRESAREAVRYARSPPAVAGRDRYVSQSYRVEIPDDGEDLITEDVYEETEDDWDQNGDYDDYVSNIVSPSARLTINSSTREIEQATGSSRDRTGGRSSHSEHNIRARNVGSHSSNYTDATTHYPDQEVDAPIEEVENVPKSVLDKSTDEDVHKLLEKVNTSLNHFSVTNSSKTDIFKQLQMLQDKLIATSVLTAMASSAKVGNDETSKLFRMVSEAVQTSTSGIGYMQKYIVTKGLHKRVSESLAQEIVDKICAFQRSTTCQMMEQLKTYITCTLGEINVQHSVPSPSLTIEDEEAGEGARYETDRKDVEHFNSVDIDNISQNLIDTQNMVTATKDEVMSVHETLSEFAKLATLPAAIDSIMFTLNKHFDELAQSQLTAKQIRTIVVGVINDVMKSVDTSLNDKMEKLSNLILDMQSTIVKSNSGIVDPVMRLLTPLQKNLNQLLNDKSDSLELKDISANIEQITYHQKQTSGRLDKLASDIAKKREESGSSDDKSSDLRIDALLEKQDKLIQLIASMNVDNQKLQQRVVEHEKQHHTMVESQYDKLTALMVQQEARYQKQLEAINRNHMNVLQDTLDAHTKLMVDQERKINAQIESLQRDLHDTIVASAAPVNIDRDARDDQDDRDIRSDQDDRDIRSDQDDQDDRDIRSDQDDQDDRDIRSDQDDRDIRSDQDDRDIRSDQDDRDIRSDQDDRDIRSDQDDRDIRSDQDDQDDRDIRGDQDDRDIREMQDVREMEMLKRFSERPNEDVQDRRDKERSKDQREKRFIDRHSKRSIDQREKQFKVRHHKPSIDQHHKPSIDQHHKPSIDQHYREIEIPARSDDRRSGDLRTDRHEKRSNDRPSDRSEGRPPHHSNEQWHQTPMTYGSNSRMFAPVDESFEELRSSPEVSPIRSLSGRSSPEEQPITRERRTGIKVTQRRSPPPRSPPPRYQTSRSGRKSPPRRFSRSPPNSPTRPKVTLSPGTVAQLRKTARATAPMVDLM